MTRGDLSRRIGSRIRSRRRELQLTQAELAGKEFTKSFISQVETGRTAPSIETLAMLAERLGRPLEWFVAEEPTYSSPLDEIAREVGIAPATARALLEELLRRL